MNTRTGATTVTALTVLLILVIPVNINYVSPLLAQSGETDEDDTSSAS
jgi:hypothetical protein